MHVFIINLEEDLGKRERIEKECQKYGLKYEIINAINGKDLSKDELNANVAYYDKEYLSKGEIGCVMSHKIAYQRIVDDNIDLALILEDDAKISNGINYILEKIEFIADPRKKQAFLLQKCKRIFINKELDLGNGYLFHESHGPKCAHGYVITNAAAEAILRINTPVTMVADNWLTFYYKTLLKTYALNHSLITSYDVEKENSRLEKDRKTMTDEQTKFRDKIITRGIKYKLFKLYHKSFRRMFLKKRSVDIHS